MLSLYILLPLAIFIILNLPLGFKKDNFAFTVTASVLAFQCFSTLLHPGILLTNFVDPLGKFFSFRLSLDAISIVALFTISLVAFVSLLTARNTIVLESNRTQFINLLLLSLIGMNATVMVRDIFTQYIFIEIIAVSVFVLMALEKNKFAIEGTFKYLVLSMISSVFMLTSIGLIIVCCSDTSFDSIRHVFLSGANKSILNFASGLFLCGLLIKCGVVPFHGWVPDAYSDTQTSISILLAGIVTKISGVYVLIRLFSTVFILTSQIQSILMLVGLISIIVAAFAAFTQNDMKRMLSYSSISQIGYIMLAVGCATPLAFIGAIFHFFNHAVFKSLLFVNTASLEKQFGSTDMTIVAGLGNNLPVTNITSLIGFLSTAGIPPLSGFWSKFLIVLALWNSGRLLYATIALLASVLTLAYFLAMHRKVFFIKTETLIENLPIPFEIAFCEILLASITIIVGFGFPFLFKTWMVPIINVLH